ncbi:cytochrome P450 72A15-like isoform X1 [Phoenix dactylifera]|uniref:Cytochrome P450 72A15-like isoform X1 n=2 Tax=Phoenix dactylifera TaxID=42345 RepID=A0A8B7BHW2_PHODC|nr:cytochrome P450 72A15-like isoform X1 [Phoenix dactylifera]
MSSVAEKLWTVGWGVMGVIVLAWAAKVVEWVWWRPRRLERALRARGLRGTRYRFLHGDITDSARLSKDARSKPIPLSHQIIPRVLPHLHQALKQYGKMSFTWAGPEPKVSIVDPDMIREVLSNKSGHLDKPKQSPLHELLFRGLAYYSGEKWARHRRIINPAFHLEKLKLMLPAFCTCCDELIEKWDGLVDSDGSCELDVWHEFIRFTGDVISRTAFSSNFREGQRIFELQAKQAKLFVQAAQHLYIPGYRLLPTKQNKQMKEIDREVRVLLRSIIEKRLKAIDMGESTNNDLLGLLLESNIRYFQEGGSKVPGMTTEDVIEECKLFYFGGHETSAVLLTWTMVVLSMNSTWQARAREEVLQVFGQHKPDFDGLSRLKIVNMILHEVLRLYPPGTVIIRKTYQEVELGGIVFPPGVQLLLPVLLVHHDPELWGEDAAEFNPERFAEGVSKASRNQGAFFPFGWGPRICIGQSFAMIEAKMALARILQHFSFELSPSYAHAPHVVITLHPQHGAQIILRRL